MPQIREFIGLKRVSELGIALPATHAHVLSGHEEEACARLVRKLAAQAADHLVDGRLALGQGLEGEEHDGRVALAAAGEARHRIQRGVGGDDGHEGAPRVKLGAELGTNRYDGKPPGERSRNSASSFPRKRGQLGAGEADRDQAESAAVLWLVMICRRGAKIFGVPATMLPVLR